MFRIGFQGARLILPCRLQLRTQVSRAAKKVTQKETLHSPEPSIVPHRPAPTATPPNPLHKQQPPAVEDAVNHADVHKKRKQKAIGMLPGFMKNFATKILNAPLSHVTSFFIVHELSAIFPLFVIWGGLYYFDYVPIGIPDFVLQSGAHFIRSVAERYDWTVVSHAEAGSRLILQGAVAWGVVKAIMPLRIAFSLWAMPGFARWFVIPITSRVSTLFRKVFTRK